jgi:hypothetical protein
MSTAHDSAFRRSGLPPGGARVVDVGEGIGSAAAAALIEAFWQAVEDGALEIWIDVPAALRDAPAIVRALEDVTVFAYELDRVIALVDGDGRAARR